MEDPMKYLAIPFLAIAMMFGGMSTDAYAGHMHKHHKMWLVKQTPCGCKWYKFDMHKHMKKHCHKCMKHKCMKKMCMKKMKCKMC